MTLTVKFDFALAYSSFNSNANVNPFRDYNRAVVLKHP